MTHATIAIIAAMPEEVGPLRRAFAAHRERARIPIYRGKAGGTDVVIVQSGMGRRNARRAVDLLLETVRPTLIISCGVGGAVRPGLDVGNVVMASAVYLLEKESLIPSAKDLETVVGATIGTVITADTIRTKEEVASLTPKDLPNPVLDMETSVVVEQARGAGIPCLAVRAISDDAGEELQFSLEEFTNNDLKLNLLKIALTVIRKPYIIPQLMRLAKNTKVAAENLAIFLVREIEKRDG